jgi:hypothetical protein
LGLVAQGEGDDAAARDLLEAGLVEARRHGHALGIADSLAALGWLALCAGDLGSARAFYAESLKLVQELGHRLEVPACLEGLAAVAYGNEDARGDGERSARLLGAAHALREAMGLPVPPDRRPGTERCLEAVRAALGGAAFASAWADGQAMSLEDAIAYALADASPDEGE